MGISNFAYLYLLFISPILLMPSIVSADTYPVDNFIQWSGVNWHVDVSMTGTPPSGNNVWVDSSGNLHMQLRKTNNKWYGTMLESPSTVKYGKFTWVASSQSLNLERNTSIGLFVYHNDTNELDIEINQWPSMDQHLWFTKQPGSVECYPGIITKNILPANYNFMDKNNEYSIDWEPNYVLFCVIVDDATILYRWDHTKLVDISSVDSTTCVALNASYGVCSSDPHLNDRGIKYSIEWTPSYVYYSAIAPDGTIILDWNYTDPEGIPSVNSTICMDLLPLAGSCYPASGNTAELILNNFTYEPY